MDKKRTNREVLAKGIQSLAMSLLAITLGPVILYNAFMNKEHSMFIPIMSIGVIFLFIAIFLILRGIKLILSSFFD